MKRKDTVVLNMLGKLKDLTDDNLDKVTKAVDACLVVQALSNITLSADKFISNTR